MKIRIEVIFLDYWVERAQLLENYWIKISKEAIKLAHPNKRKTVKKEDVKLAAKR